MRCQDGSRNHRLPKQEAVNNLGLRSLFKRTFTSNTAIKSCVDVFPWSFQTTTTNMSIRQDLPSCLRWNIFGDLQDIEIVSGTNEHGHEMRTPLFEHPMAAQSLARPPLSRVKVSSMDITEAQTFNVVSEDFVY